MRNTLRSVDVACWYQNRPQDAQKGRPARPQRAKWRIVLLPYGELLGAVRTPLADFFRILLDIKAHFDHRAECQTQILSRLFFELLRDIVDVSHHLFLVIQLWLRRFNLEIRRLCPPPILLTSPVLDRERPQPLQPTPWSWASQVW